MFPGVSRPYGVVKIGPDCDNGGDAYSGYQDNGNVTGFSMMHESGTGGSPKYGVVSQMPMIGNITNPLVNMTTARSSPDEAQIGYYKSSLASGIAVELAATEHAGIYQYTFPAASTTNHIIVDISHVLPSSRRLGISQTYVHGNVTILPDGHYEGSGIYNGGWNYGTFALFTRGTKKLISAKAPDWTIYFCGRFSSTPSKVQTYSGSGTTLQSFGSNTAMDGNQTVGAIFTFAEKSVSSTVGISFISSAKACGFVDNELPNGTELPTVVNATKDSWNSQVLSKITTTETSIDHLTLLYSSLYGMHLLPSNRTGENPGWESTEPYYDDLYTLWDLFRCTTALTHILQPVAYEEQIRSMIDIWRHDGYLPDGRSSNYNGRIQGGTNADNVLADAYVKGVRGAVNWNDAYRAMLKNAEVQPVNNNDPMAPDSSTKEGRGALPDWIKYGWITPNYTRAVSRAIEYSGNDFGLYQVATGLGVSDDATKYLSRSRNWRNHWNSDAKSLGFEGFVLQRKANGDFIEHEDPLSCGGCYWHDPYYEGLPWEYSFGAHHDMATLIRYSNGSDTFVNRLNTIFQNGSNPHGDPHFNKTIFGAGNEPSFTSPYLFNFAGQQHKSVEISRQVATSYYSTGVAGLPGNSDAGAMQSWLLWNIIGLYPITGQTTFLIGSPWFDNLNISLGGGKKLVVNSVGGGGGNTSYYVQSLKVNGKSWNKNWLVYDDIFKNGGTLDFKLGSEPVNWDTGDLPPSPASVDTGKAPKPRYRRHRQQKYLVALIAFGVCFCTTIFGAGLFLLARRRRIVKKPVEDQKPSKKNEKADGCEDSSSSITQMVEENEKVDNCKDSGSSITKTVEEIEIVDSCKDSSSSVTKTGEEDDAAS